MFDESDDFLLEIHSEIELFRKSGFKGHILKRLYECLLTIRPHTVDVERIFSSSGHILTKLRSRISDQILDSHFFESLFQL